MSDTLKIIIGLGNPEKKYLQTRHNIGFLTIDQLKNSYDSRLAWSYEKFLDAEVTRYDSNTTSVIFMKPQTYMNNSGISVKNALKKYDITPKDTLVIHDDLDISIGSFKLQLAVSPKQHNGILSIENHLGTKDFFRLRIGIENRDKTRRIPGDTYVLSDFSTTELGTIFENVPNIRTLVDNWLNQ